MRRSVFAVALLTMGCRPDPLPSHPSATVDWALSSADGRFQVQQSREGSSCRVEARVLPSRPLWTSRTCVPAGALAFLSPDGRRMLVLDVFPPKPEGDPSDLPLVRPSDLPVVSLWADGAVLRQYTRANVLGPAAEAGARGQLSWVRGGSAEAVRAAARASPTGDAVQVELTDGRTLELRFDGALYALRVPEPGPTVLASGAGPRETAAPPPVEERAAAPAEPQPSTPPEADARRRPSRRATAAAEAARAPPPDAAAQDALGTDEVGLYRWEDESGALHFGSGSQIPPRLRRRAVPVSASVGVVPVDHLSAQPPAAGTAAPAAGAAPGAAAPAASPEAPQGAPQKSPLR